MKKKRNFISQRRITFLALLLRALAVVLALTILFSIGFQVYLKRDIDDQCREQLDERLINLRQIINEMESYQAEISVYDRMREIRLLLATNAFSFAVFLPGHDHVSDDAVLWPDCDSSQSLNFHTCAVLVDKEGNVAASSRLILAAFIDFGDHRNDENPYSSLYSNYLCDPEELNIPEVDQFFELYQEHARQTENEVHHVQASINSLYVNRKTRTFVPREGVLQEFIYSRSDWGSEEFFDKAIQKEYPVEINIDLPDYEVVELHEPAEREEDQAYPSGSGVLFFKGESHEVMDMFKKNRPFSFGGYTPGGYVNLGDGKAIFDGNTEVNIDNQPYLLNLRLMIDYKDINVVRYYWQRVLFFAAVISLLALLWCLWKNQKNKLRYAMEDYQRTLTDNLAHDIKTPLMAISGYAENIRDGNLPEAKHKQYVGAIMENVSYTDALVSRTLQLNHMGETKQEKPEEIAVGELVGELLRKYELLIEEKQITYSIDGGASVQAERAGLETILENLISNAIKYTPEGGKIQIKMDKKTLTVTNTVTQKLDVRKLKEPFVRGDGARSNVKGNGLGLAIADRAADANGFKLRLSCTENEFKAELRR
ncbi:MAG: HAMP domain-containing histidine kinase [Oscillospiraceae bacterium]|nr:HAMP domain-containing histidine kinase [Oscillospiraceae bacterium]